LGYIQDAKPYRGGKASGKRLKRKANTRFWNCILVVQQQFDVQYRGGPMKHERSILLLPLLVLLSLTFAGPRAQATTYAVKAGGGGNYTSISSCAAVAVAGDTCTVYAGSYSGWTQPTNGSAGKPITFQANPGDTVTITGGVTISSRSYITISHFTFPSGGVSGNGSTSHNIIDHNTFTGAATAFNIADGQGSNGSDNVFSNNTVSTSSSGNVVGIYLYGDRNRIEFNDISHTDGDCMDLGGANVVVRGNKCHDVSGASGQHVDFIQVIGAGTTPTLSFSLVEGNTEQNCTNDGGNCHFIIIRTGSGPVADTDIIRYNYAQNLDAQGPVSFGGVGDNVPNAHFYNNTVAPESLYDGNGSCVSWQGAPNGRALNNICYNTGTATNKWSPFYDFSGGGLVEDTTLAFTSGYSGAWSSPYAGETTYPGLHSQNPLFANYPADASLQSSSPAKGGGVPLTTIASGDSGSGTSLVVADARFFQPGWAGTQGDWIRIGASSTVQITAINYSNNTITLASSIGRSKGDPVYLYKDSNGDTVLNGANPDVGGYLAVGSNPPPQNLQSSVH
jgi:hypothetical protein